jgi:hypothetical protein
MVLGLVPLIAMYADRNDAPKVSFAVLAVLWSLIGLAAALQLGIFEDPGLPVAAALLVAALAGLRARGFPFG